MAVPNNEELQDIRSYLLRYARLRLRDPVLAEDAVQETLLASLNGGAPFAGKAQYKTWLVGILKHKIIDVIHKNSRERPFTADEEAPESELIAGMFKANGQWPMARASLPLGQSREVARRQEILGNLRTVSGRDARTHRSRIHDERSDGAHQRRNL